jgi:hypothetical protein
MEVINELRAFEKCIQERLEEFEKEPESNNDLIMQDKAILEAIQKKL